ncbi:UNVERIFIED_CONTAM: AAA family ATPase [Campylobacter lari]
MDSAIEIKSNFEEGLIILSKYKKLNQIQKDLKENLTKCLKNFEEIKVQYNALLKQNEIIKSLDKFQYIDLVNSQKFINELDLINNKNHINFNKLFYDLINKKDFLKLIDNKNNKYINDNINDPIFNKVNGFSLDIDQRKAILYNEQNTLVVAGAGSGKTLTICGMVKYLLEKKNIKPNEILLLSYSKKSANDLNRKLKLINSDLEATTFHSLGYQTLKKMNKKTPTVYDQLESFIENYFKFAIENNENMREKIFNFYALYNEASNENIKFDNLSQFYDNILENDFITLKNKLCKINNLDDKKSNNKQLKTLRKEKVKSYEELVIANFYFINGINYEYESKYKYISADENHREYLPDFYLPEYDI